MNINKTAFILLIIISLLFPGCGRRKTEIVLTTDFLEDEVFRIENSSCFKKEVMVYLVNSENSYDLLFGPEIWKTKLPSEPSDDMAVSDLEDPEEPDSAFSVAIDSGNGSNNDTATSEVTVEDKYKETILARLAQIKALNLLAAERGVVLDEEDEQKITAAAKFYMDSLNESEIALLGVTETDIYDMYKDYAIADKLYHEITDGIEPEISDDAARTITIGSILVKTYKTDAYGNRTDYSREDMQKAYERALEIKKKLDDGTEFDVLADSYYNEDSQTEYTFGRGVMPYSLENAAFSLGNGEISDIIKTEYGYHIIKCKSTFNKEATEKNKQAIITKTKQDTFSTVYEEYITTLKSNLNEPLWQSISYEKEDGITTTGFFDIYDSYFTVIHDEYAPG
ncbi:MAG: peptidylprolyl isomerase [Lachnospiraceae bacterium]|nr:peptidylprolyl isomerase [Lachnospiraceae bacterium]